MTKSNILTDNKEIKRSGWLNEFLWSCAGVNKEVLRQCPSDYAKYAGIGGTILFTALMASFSGGYALSFVFGKWWIGMIFGIFWGLLIFNLDRFIVNTMYSDGKVTIGWQEFKSGFPRILMAIFLGIVISYPLELKIFDDEIQVKIEDMKQERLLQYIQKDQNKVDSLELIVAQEREKPISFHDTEIVMGNEQLNNLNSKKNELTNQINVEVGTILAINKTISLLRNDNEDGKNDFKINEKIRERQTHQTNKNNLQVELNRIITEVSVLNPQVQDVINRATKAKEDDINRYLKEIEVLKLNISKADSTYRQILDKNFNGFQAQMLAFSEMKGSKAETDLLFSSTQWASLLIMILFIIIETAPTFFKMMMEDGPYDNLLRAEKYKAKVLSDKRISDVNDAVNTCVLISTMKNEKRLEAETIANKDILEKIAKAQSELLEVAIKKWKEEELKKVEENPSEYILSSVPSNSNQSMTKEEENLSEFIHNEVSELMDDNECFK